jgi:predicted naringenin-chalcone synthase
MPLQQETYERALYYFRNRVSRSYREIRHLGTHGSHEPLKRFYAHCKEKSDEGRQWVDPFYYQSKAESDLGLIERIFSEELNGLSLDLIREAFAEGQWNQAMGGLAWAKIVHSTLELRALITDGVESRVRDGIAKIDSLSHNTRRVVEDFFPPD